MKENKIEKLVLDLSNRWDCSPEEAVDRLNSMNESEINNLINSMTKKFQMGGRAFGPKIPYGNYMIIGTKTEVLPKKSEVTQAQIDSAYNAEQDAFRKRAEQLIPELEQRNAETKQRLGNNQNWQTIKANSPVQMPVTNSDPQYFNGPRNFKFENGGMIDCLRNGGSFQKCKCGDKVAKGAGGVRITQQQDVYPEMTVKRNDGVNGTFKREYDRYNNRVETLTQRRPDGLVMATTRTITPDQIDTSYTSGPINSMDFQQYVTPTKYKGMNFLQKMFNKVVPENWDAKFDRYKNGGELKKCGGSLKKKK